MLGSIVGLSANTRYWLSLYLGDISNTTHSAGFVWQSTATDGIESLFPGTAEGGLYSTGNANNIPPQSPVWGANGTVPLAFQLYGEIPLPTTMALLAPMLLVSALWRRRRIPR
jgi:hypothetical protein